MRSSLRNLAPSPPEGPPAVIPDCAGDCRRCRDEHAAKSRNPVCPQNEAWLVRHRSLTRVYRLDEVRRVYGLLEEIHSTWALAVYYQLVEPWAEWHPEKRRQLCRSGVRVMAGHMRGDLPTFAPRVPKRRPVAERERDVKVRRVRGWSRDRIAKRLRMRGRDVSRLRVEVAFSRSPPISDAFDFGSEKESNPSM